MSTLSYFITKTIVWAYKLAGNEELVLASVHGQHVRAMAPSHAFYCVIPLDQFLAVSSWRCHDTFTSFYLQNLSEVDSQGYRLGLIVIL